MRSQFLPYCLPSIGEEEIAEVIDSLRSGWITTGPKVGRFERQFQDYVGAQHAVAVNSCTAALHLSLACAGVQRGDEVIVPTLTFAATANVVVHLGATPVLADVDPHGLLDVAKLEPLITPRTRAVIPVHFAGQACEMDTILGIASDHQLAVIEDAAHAVGALYKGRHVGTLGQFTAFSFYATKNMTTGEGGMITTSESDAADRLRRLSLHGMSRDAWKRYEAAGSWYYEVLEAGYKSNMTDIAAALGIHQLRRLESFISRRRDIAAAYGEAFREVDEIVLPVELPQRRHVFHIYPVRLKPEAGIARNVFIERLKERGIGTSVHFTPLHLHPFYRRANDQVAFPGADSLYRGLLSLPLYPGMTDDDVTDVVNAVKDVLAGGRTRIAMGFGKPDFDRSEVHA